MAKFDTGKASMTLLYKSFKESVAKVRMLGVKKYGHREDWRSVERVRYYDAAMRHLDQAMEAEIEGKGNMIDEESGETHLAHAACCLMFLIEGNIKNKQKSVDVCPQCGEVEGVDEKGRCPICNRHVTASVIKESKDE